MTRTYQRGLDVLGAVGSGRAVLVRLADVGALVKTKAGKYAQVASVVSQLAPNTVEAKVYDEMVKKLREGFRDQGVDAEVSVVDVPGLGAKPSSGGGEFLIGAGVGAGAVGLGVFLWRIFRRRR